VAAARAILGAVHRDDLPAALASLDESHAELAAERRRIAATIERSLGAPRSPCRRARPVRPVSPIGAGGAGLASGGSRRTSGCGRRCCGSGRAGACCGRPGAGPGYRLYDPAEQRVARLIAVLRGGGLPFAIIEPAIVALRDRGSTAAALDELSRRSAEIDDLSHRRLQATAALAAYLATYYGPRWILDA